MNFFHLNDRFSVRFRTNTDQFVEFEFGIERMFVFSSFSFFNSKFSFDSFLPASGSNSTTLPSQCTTYSTSTDQYRLATSSACCYTPDCAGNLATNWYRFIPPGGTQLATSPVSTGFCGTTYPAWYNGTLPATAGTTVTGVTCSNYGGTICSTSYATTISITNCNGFYVFYLTPFSICNIRYCTI